MSYLPFDLVASWMLWHYRRDAVVMWYIENSWAVLVLCYQRESQSMVTEDKETRIICVMRPAIMAIVLASPVSSFSVSVALGAQWT